MRMMLMLLMTLSTVAMPLTAAGPHGNCDSNDVAALGIVDTGLGIYVDDRGGVLGNGLWVYQESNHEAGLQRGGSSPYVPGDNEICYDDSPNGPDTLIL